MSEDVFERTRKLIGEQALSRLSQAYVAVFGIGGVGSYAVEALARAGVGKLLLVDGDIIKESNINRQLIALHSTLGKYKTQAAKERAMDINPDIEVIEARIFYGKDNCSSLPLDGLDYIIDAIDTVTSKILLIEKANESGIPIISAMGAGNKLNPSMFEVADIYQTSVCPLARVIRTELKKRSIPSLKVVYSKELPAVKERTPASISFVPPVAGLLMAAQAIKDIAKL
ncbi:MAG: tRNA threonylcarbamoyladenosine dehydratase [Christensenellales bacterium]|jgi:tRNA A37 threonylcarbamoyladenosine dehydratase|nr:tRNA threonylcarbamoyladenosine dehydratase [Clostridiales bacterium]